MSEGYELNFLSSHGSEAPGHCAVVSVYEDLPTRTSLIQLCDSIVRQFVGVVDFHFDWWRFKFLADPEIAMEAAQMATQADMILLAPKSGTIPGHVQLWFDGWLPHRESREGALVLVQPQESSRLAQLPSYLRLSARRANLDYLRVNPPVMSAPDRSTVAGLSLTQLEMDELIQRTNRSSHWGINE